MTLTDNFSISSPLLQRIHGGPDASGVPRFDFSTNSNACGPCPIALAAVQQADATHYPDASYTALRQQLAAFHHVEVSRVLLAGSASEFIFRITAWVAQHALQQQQNLQNGGHFHHANVCLPLYSYGDYAQAALAWGLGQTTQPDAADLVWACEPSSPLGGPHAAWPRWLTEVSKNANATPDFLKDAQPKNSPTLVLDCAYEPLRLSGASSLTEAQRAQVWQLWTPNKALGLTGVRAAYVIAPLGSESTVAALERLCASWPVGAHGVALLQTWVLPEVQAWLAESLQTLNIWKARQIERLQTLGWQCLPSDTPFFCARPYASLDVADLPKNLVLLNRDLKHLRTSGFKLRDATSFGLPGHVRVSVQPPMAQEALALAWAELVKSCR